MLERLRLKDIQALNIVLLAIVTFIECMHFLIILVFIYSFIPVDPGPVFPTIYPHLRDVLQPERDLFYYRIFVVVNVIAQIVLLYFFRRRLADKDFTKKMIPFIAAEGFWLLLQCFVVFKILLFNNPLWPHLLYGAMALPILSKLYWPEVLIWAKKGYRLIHRNVSSRVVRLWDVGFILLIVVLLFPDVKAVVSRIFLNDSFRHFDSFVMAPGWTALCGLTLNVDVLSQYSVVLPSIIAWMAQLMGGFDYMNVMTVIISLSIIYFCLLYGFLRLWQKSILIASIGILWAIKLQMFQMGAAPIIWQFPSATVVRSFLDIIIIFLMFKHIQEPRKILLGGVALLCGLALCLMLDTGIYITLAFYSYLFLLVVLPDLRKKNFTHPRDILVVVGLVTVPIVAMLLILRLFQGPAIWSKEYWSHANEFMNLFLQGWGALPVYYGLRERNFFAFFTGLAIPLIYVWTMITVGALIFLQKIHKANLLAIILSVYGLGLYHYFICRSAVTSYYTVSIPLVLILCYWLEKFSKNFSFVWRRNILCTVLVLSLGALLTNTLFLLYPNIFNLSRPNWKREKMYFQQNGKFLKDIALIQRYSSKEDRVPVVSSFDVKLLIDAKRKPFFFYFPLLESRQMNTNEFGGTYLFTKKRMERVLTQLDTERPVHVFVEKKLFKGLIPMQYFQHYETLTRLMGYFHKNYEIEDEGEYLVVLKHK